MAAIRQMMSLVAVVCCLALSALALPLIGAATVADADSSTSVATTTVTFVDTARSTPPWDGVPGKPSRTLVTTIWYPTTVSSSVAYSQRRPIPPHRLRPRAGRLPQDYQRLLTSWAAAGFVVAAPLFPLTSSQTTGGPDGGDIVNQPGDMSFVIDLVLSAWPARGILSGWSTRRDRGRRPLERRHHDLRPLANCCCRDPRVKAAVVMGGKDHRGSRPWLLRFSKGSTALRRFGCSRRACSLYRCCCGLQPGPGAEGTPCAQLGHFL